MEPKLILMRIDSVSEPQTFRVESGALRVTDPCYDMDTWCAGSLIDVQNGNWRTVIGKHKDKTDLEMFARCIARDKANLAKGDHIGFFQNKLEEAQERERAYSGRVAYLHIWNEQVDYIPFSFNPKRNWIDSYINVGVDSGQAGFYDYDYFKSMRSDDRRIENFYELASDKSLSDDSWGVTKADDSDRIIGVTSSSGYGDGGYDCFVRKTLGGKVIEAVITYLAFTDIDEDEIQKDL